MIVLYCGFSLCFESGPCPTLSCPVLSCSRFQSCHCQEWRVPGISQSYASAPVNHTSIHSCLKDDVNVEDPSCVESIKSSFTVKYSLSHKTAVLQNLQNKTLKNPRINISEETRLLKENRRRGGSDLRQTGIFHLVKCITPALPAKSPPTPLKASHALPLPHKETHGTEGMIICSDFLQQGTNQNHKQLPREPSCQIPDSSSGQES